MFLDEFKKEVGKQLQIAAELMKQGSSAGYNHLKNTLSHALFFGYEDESIRLLHNILGPVRNEVITKIAGQNKPVMVDIGRELELIADALINGESLEKIINPASNISLKVYKEWRRISTSSDFIPK